MGQTSIQHIAGNIGNGEYPATKQALFNEFVANLRSFLPAGRGEFIISSNTPTDRDVIWVELSTAGVFLGLRRWDGTAWVSMAPPNQTITTVTTTPYAVLPTDRVILVNSSSAKVVNLTNPATRAGQLIFIQDATGSAQTYNITINAYAATTINGAASVTIQVNRGGVLLVSNGTNDIILQAQLGPPAQPIVLVASSPYTVLQSDRLILVDTTAARAINLTNPAGRVGQVIYIQDRTGTAAANNITINAYAATSINGVATKVINTNFGGVAIVSDGTNDIILP